MARVSTVSEVASALQVSVSTVNNAINRGLFMITQHDNKRRLLNVEECLWAWETYMKELDGRAGLSPKQKSLAMERVILLRRRKMGAEPMRLNGRLSLGYVWYIVFIIAGALVLAGAYFFVRSFFL